MEERFSQNFNKLYYSIGEVAEIFGVNASLIRFWEKEFEIINPKKNAKGNRKFTPKDIEILNQIYDLVKIKGFTLDGAKKALFNKEIKIKDDSVSELSEDLKLKEIQSSLQKIRLTLLALKSN